ncbi:MAG: type II secretion system secretin GspD [Pseudomonadota bacterium]
MKNPIAFALAAATILSGCDQLNNPDEATRLEPWRQQTILGPGDETSQDRSQGRITGARDVRVGRGTIFPGRQPLLRDSDFVNDSGERTVSLNLVDIPIEEAAAAILGELLRENYVIDPGVTGTVNIRSSQPVSRTTAIEVFELALKQNNAALVRRGDLFAIVPISGDLTLGANTAREVSPGFSLRVVPLSNIGAQEMAAILQPFAGDGIVGIDAQRNIIVLAGTSADQRSWQKTIASFDVDWLANRSVGIFPIKGRAAQSIINALQRVVETDESFEPLAVFEVIPENNSILAVAKTPRALESVSVWIQRLTQQGQNDAQIFSYDMKFARASEVAPTLSQILGIQVEAATAEMDDAIEENADAELVAAAFDDTGLGTQNATRVVASTATNTLLIHATQDEYERILGVLHRLDVPQRQVLVEATIVEVSLNDELRYGVQYFLEGDGNDTVALTNNNEDRSLVAQVPGFSAVLGNDTDVIIDALDEVTRVNVVSSPNLMILNNESARLVVGDQVPVSVRTATDVEDADDNVFVSTVEFRDTGVIFEVTPRINSSGSVVLDIDQEVSTVGATDPSTGNPIISQRTLSSSVSVDSGETIALGGLFETRATRGRSGIPVLSDIPVAGRLFGQTSNRDQQTELLVLITPRIVNNALDARRVTRQLRERVTSLQLGGPSLSTSISVPELSTPNSEFIEKRDQGTAPRPELTPPPAVSRNVVETAATTGGTHYAVLGAFGQKGAAEEHWATLTQTNPGVLGKLQPVFRQAGDLTTVSVGPMAQKAAMDVCVGVTSDCFLATK